MSIKIELNPKQLAEKLDMHYLPAKINGDGAANVDTYFNNYTRAQHDIQQGLLSNSLRGYPLLGEAIELPVGYKGLVVQETETTLEEHADRWLRITGTFDKFTYWNYDKIPTKADPLKLALQNITVAEALAAPISALDVEKQIKRHTEETASKEN